MVITFTGMKYKKGDVIQDHIGKIKIRDIAKNLFDNSLLVFIDPQLNKDGTISTTKNQRTIFEEDIIDN